MTIFMILIKIWMKNFLKPKKSNHKIFHSIVNYDKTWALWISNWKWSERNKNGNWMEKGKIIRKEDKEWELLRFQFCLLKKLFWISISCCRHLKPALNHSTRFFLSIIFHKNHWIRNKNLFEILFCMWTQFLFQKKKNRRQSKSKLIFISFAKE